MRVVGVRPRGVLTLNGALDKADASTAAEFGIDEGFSGEEWTRAEVEEVSGADVLEHTSQLHGAPQRGVAR